MKRQLTYRLYILAKPGDERFFVFTRLPNAIWIEQQRAKGYELLETTLGMPPRYDVDIDGYAEPEIIFSKPTCTTGDCCVE